MHAPQRPGLLPALALCTCVVAAIPHAAAAEPGQALGQKAPSDARFALVVGHNDSDDPDLSPLRYADDDAIRYADLLSQIAEATLLTTMDDETRRLMEGRAQIDGPPTRASLLAQLDVLRDRMAAARQAGKRPVLYFVYSGHGNYDAEGRGYVHLADGRFTTRDLYHHLFEPSQGDPVVLIVDACNAALLVNSRGASGPERRPSMPSRLNLEAYPNVGVVLASSSVGETHEWGRYLAGVFSHEVRSGLVGPADLDDDGRITFPELATFVTAANARVKNPTVRVTPYIRPPLTDPGLALVDLRTSAFPVQVRIPRDFTGKTHVVDADLVRFADFHKTGDQAFNLALTRSAPFVIIHEDTEFVVGADVRGTVELTSLPTRDKTMVSARGAGSEYFERTLFHEPLSGEFAKTYLERDYVESLEVRRYELAPWYDNTGAWLVVGSGITLMAAGGGFAGMAMAAEGRAERARWADERADANSELRTYRDVSTALLATGGAAIVGGAIWFALDRRTVETRYQPPIEVSLTPQGVLLRGGM